MQQRTTLLVAATLLTALAASGAIGAVPGLDDPFPTAAASCHGMCLETCDLGAADLADPDACREIDGALHDTMHDLYETD